MFVGGYTVSQHASTEAQGVSGASHNGSSDGIEQRQAYRQAINTNLASALPYQIGDKLQLLCECGHPDCNEWITVELNLYGAVRRRPAWRLVRTQHEHADADLIRRRYLAFNVVETVSEPNSVNGANGAGSALG
jgi:hypothetical protein